MLKIPPIIKTALGIASIFVIGLLFKEVLKLTDNKNNFEKSAGALIKGVAAMEKADYNDATIQFQKAIKYDTTNIEAYNNLGRSFYLLKDYEKAIESLTSNHNNAITFLYRGDAHFSAENYSIAFIDYTESLKIQPTPEAFCAMANVFIKMNNTTEGIRNYSKAIELDSVNALYYNHRGNAHNLLGNYNDAIKDFGKAIELSPDNLVYKQSLEFALRLETTAD